MNTPRLCRAVLHGLPQNIELPGYDTATISTGVVHIGPGAFHRVHQAAAIDTLLSRDPKWGLCEVALKSSGIRDALASQDGLYTLAILDEQVSYRVVGAVRELLVASEGPQAVVARLADPAVRLVTLTITEKGYRLGPDGDLDCANPDIAWDLSHPEAPRSAIGFLVAGLAARRAASAGPPTILSCDNLTDNGRRLRHGVLQFAESWDKDLAQWIADAVPFPRTMVDSITPATTDILRQEVASAIGVEDAWPVQREAFSQWVIEADARAVNPGWERAGVTLSSDVGGYEQCKLRLLNGAHSALAYVGLLRGYETVSEAIASPDLQDYLKALMQEVIPTLAPPPGLDPASYGASLLRRFGNRAIVHRLEQIAWDGSMKLPFRLLGSISDALKLGSPIEYLSLAVAAWMAFVVRQAREGVTLTDPRANELAALGKSCDGTEGDLARFLSLNGIFPAQLCQSDRFRAALARGYNHALLIPSAYGQIT